MMDLDTKAEVLCNLRGQDPNDEVVWEQTKAEIIRDNINFQE